MPRHRLKEIVDPHPAGGFEGKADALRMVAEVAMHRAKIEGWLKQPEPLRLTLSAR